MPRAGQVKPSDDERLSDRIAIGVLTATFPPELVDRVVEETGRRERRHRLLPARVVVYFTLAMCVFGQVGYEEVARLLTHGLAWAKSWRGAWQVPTTGSLARARARLGPEPLQALFERTAGPLATPATPGAWYRDWRLVVVDGTTLDVADTPANTTAFGRPKTHRGEQTAFPQVRLVGVAECGTHALMAAAMGPLTKGETTLTAGLLGAGTTLGVGMLLLADRLFTGAELWRQAQQTGADLLWRTRSNAVLPVLGTFPDGSYLSQITAATDRRRGVAPTVVRVVEYRLDDPGRAGAKGQVYRLLTTILDPERAPAPELAALYHQRWEVEGLLDELKVHQRGPKVVLRSKTPRMVAQEVWAMLLVHRAIRTLMHHAALDPRDGEALDPDRLSFTRALRVIRRQVTDQAAFSP
jgi:Insertion element 4 transposase N-terminal/Transposase DDE domain